MLTFNSRSLLRMTPRTWPWKTRERWRAWGTRPRTSTRGSTSRPSSPSKTRFGSQRGLTWRRTCRSRFDSGSLSAGEWVAGECKWVGGRWMQVNVRYAGECQVIADKSVRLMQTSVRLMMMWDKCHTINCRWVSDGWMHLILTFNKQAPGRCRWVKRWMQMTQT